MSLIPHIQPNLAVFRGKTHTKPSASIVEPRVIGELAERRESICLHSVLSDEIPDFIGRMMNSQVEWSDWRIQLQRAQCREPKS